MANSQHKQIPPGWMGVRLESEREEVERARDAAANWVREKWRGHACPYCGVADWWVGIPLQLPVITAPEPVSPPLFPVTCSNCGNTVFVNAIISGLDGEETQGL
jgi:hypothetical protein